MRNILISVISLALSVSVFPQSVTETRIAKTTALEVYDKYLSAIGNLYSGNVYNLDIFLSLFDEEALIYNDILPENNPQLITPQQYFDIFTNNIQLSYYDYDKMELGFPTRKEDKWLIDCEYGRDVRFKTPGKFYSRWHFDYIITIAMDTLYDVKNKIYANARIQSIAVKEPLTEFFIIENPQNYVLKYYGEVIDGWDKDYFSRTFSSQDIDRSRIEVADSKYFSCYNFIENTENSHFLNIQKYSKDIFGFGMYYSPVGIGNNINHVIFPNINLSNQGLFTEFLYGFQLAQNNKTAFFFNTKLNFNVYRNKFIGKYYTQYNSIDSDNDPYLRKIKINSLQEKFYTFTASLPISFEYLLRVSNNRTHPIFLSLEAGGFAEYRVWATNKFFFIADYTGFYNYYAGVEFDHYYDYGHFELNNKNIKQILISKINNFDYGAFGAFGVWYARDKNNLFKFNMLYKHGFQPLLKYRDTFILSENFTTYETLLQNSNQGLRNFYFGISYISTIKRKIKHN